MPLPYSLLPVKRKFGPSDREVLQRVLRDSPAVGELLSRVNELDELHHIPENTSVNGYGGSGLGTSRLGAPIRRSGIFHRHDDTLESQVSGT